MRDRYSASDERCVGMRGISRQAYLLHSELGQARQNFLGIHLFSEQLAAVRLAQKPASPNLGKLMILR